MPHSQPRKETRKIKVVDLEKELGEEVFPVSDLDCVMPKMGVPITSTYRLDQDTDREFVIANVCQGLQITMAEYRSLAGLLETDSKGKLFVRRSTDQANFPVEINYLEHTDFPSYSELEQRNFPASELNERLLPPGFTPCSVPTPEKGVPVTMVQLNFIRGGLIIGTVVHHICVDAKGLDAVMSRLNSTTPLPRDRIPEVEAKLRSLKYADETPSVDLEPGDMGQAIFHFRTSSLAALKAAASTGKPDQWISTCDAVAALMWRCVARARLDFLGLAADMCHPVVLEHSLNVRDYVKPPVPDTYPGNTVSFSCVETSLDRLLAPDSLPEHAVLVRAAVNKWRSWDIIKSTMDYVASFPNRTGIQFNLDIIKGIDAVVTNWRVVSAYRTWDFGFGQLQALRWATPVFDGYIFFLPQRPKDDPDEGMEVYLGLEKSCMERLLQDEELAKWAEVRCQ
ncbi:Transferase [Macrophomina phaseolina MS6]|uniref:Transferase n=1 Tax=Macrophomina phaseolina (strain MS6) TaxID=1126212 RepID=K2QLE2_MACPH|nr:Transferase [Macrophomina phaseolina MS6]